MRNRWAKMKAQLSPAMHAANAAVVKLVLANSEPPPKPKQNLQPVQAFSKLKYPEYKPAIQAAWDEARQKEAGATKPRSTTPPLAFRNAFMLAKLAIQPPEVHKLVADLIEEEHEIAMEKYSQKLRDDGLLTDGDLSLSQEDRDALVEARARIRFVPILISFPSRPTHTLFRCVKNLETMLASVVQNIEKLTGLVMHCFVGGPDLDRKGKIGVWQ